MRPSRARRSRIWALMPSRNSWLGAITPVRSRSSGESFSQRAATAPAMLSGFTSATLELSLSNALPISPARLASTASFRSGSRWRMISSIVAVFMPAACSCAKGLPASTASNCLESPTSTSFGIRSSRAIRSRSRAWTVEARKPSSTTSAVFANAARISFAPFLVSRPSATPLLRARNRCKVSDSMPDSAVSVRTAEADGASPTMRQPFFSASARARSSIRVLPTPA